MSPGQENCHAVENIVLQNRRCGGRLSSTDQNVYGAIIATDHDVIAYGFRQNAKTDWTSRRGR